MRAALSASLYASLTADTARRIKDENVLHWDAPL
jgi:hypothetical protein